jgi:CBS domain-containing protein
LNCEGRKRLIGRILNAASPHLLAQELRDSVASIPECIRPIPVGEGDQLVGMITDRDIAVRAVAAGKPPNTPIADVMSHQVKYC